jgi:integrase
MPLKAYPRGTTWWAKGRVEYNGRPITNYIRESTGADGEAGARDWIADREDRERRRYVIGEERAITFADAMNLYEPTPTMARYLIPIGEKIGDMLIGDIAPKMVRDLGAKLYPENCCDSWRRWVITPVRAVINNAHDLGRCPPIKIKGYSEDERIEQDKRRGKTSRAERTPGSWEWLLRFREHAGPYHGALALFMFATGARVGQATAMHPTRHLDLQNGRACIPAAKGHADRWIDIPEELVAELANLPPKQPRGWARTTANLRVFGFASKDGQRKGWITACRLAGIDYLPPHSAGRHGFGQEHVIRQGGDDKAIGAFGGWRDTALLRRTYTHAEDVSTKIHAGFRTGRVQGETSTGLKLRKDKA